MSTVSTQVREFLAAQDNKVALKSKWQDMQSSDEGYFEARNAFRAADDNCETLFAALIGAINEAREEDTFDDAVEELSSTEQQSLRRLLSERGMLELLESAETGLPALVRKYRVAADVFTAAQKVNSLRQSYEAEEVDAELDTCPTNIAERAWDKAVTMFRNGVDALIEAIGSDEQLEDIHREVAYDVVNKTRSKNDKLHEQLVTVVGALLESGRLDSELVDLEPEVRRWVYGFVDHVPQRQVQTQTQRQTREVAVIDPEAEVDEFLESLGLQ